MHIPNCALPPSRRYQTDVVLLALGITSAVVIALTTFALTTKNDFTSMGSYLYAGRTSCTLECVGWEG